MKDSGIEWIGKVPIDWEVRKLSDVAERITDFVASGSFASLKDNVEYLDEPDYAMLVRTVDLSQKMVKKPVFINESAYNFLSNSNLFGGELILPNIGSVGDVYKYIPIYQRASLAPNAILVDMKEHNQYYYYYFLSPSSSEMLKNIGSDSVQLKFNKTQLRQIRVLRPRSDEQIKIAEFLDKKTKSLSNIIEQTKSTIEDYKLLKQSIITEAVTKGLDKNVEMKDSGVEWIGEIPQHWNIMKIKQTVRLRDEKGEFDSAKDCFIGLENIESQSGKYIVTNTKYDSGLNPIYMKDDILFGKLRPYLTKCIRAEFSGFCTSELLIIKEFIGNKRFLQLYLLSPIFIDQVNSSTYGTKMPRANWSFIKEVEIPIPPIEEQNAIETFFDEKLKKIDDLIESKEKLLIDLYAYKKSLIYEYVTGKREVK